MIYVRPDARGYFEGEKAVDDFLQIPCDVVRRFKNRRTGRFERNGRAFYIKVHDRGGWWPIADELLHLRPPQVGARSEWLALNAIRALGIPVPPVVAFGEEGRTPATQRSFLITEEVAPVISLEKLAALPEAPPLTPSFKRCLIRSVAAIARTLHTNGINHRDFYLCHFLLNASSGIESLQEQEPRLILIDLHRAQQREHTPRRWSVKDLGGLLFSAMDVDLSPRDLALFVRCYSGTSVKTALKQNSAFWRAVRRRAESLYRKTHARPPRLDLRARFADAVR
jgi:heptose I phosphotransferase